MEGSQNSPSAVFQQGTSPRTVVLELELVSCDEDDSAANLTDCARAEMRAFLQAARTKGTSPLRMVAQHLGREIRGASWTVGFVCSGE